MSLSRPLPSADPRFDDWMFQFWKEITAPSSGIVETNHAALGNLNSQAFTHLTAAQAASLINGQNATGHYHATDRDRANHTGTQASITISDFAVAVRAAARKQPYTVALLPAAVAGDCALATDLLAPAFLAAAVGGGAVVGPVFWNGAAWIVG